jgi:hypothetical protein
MTQVLISSYCTQSSDYRSICGKHLDPTGSKNRIVILILDVPAREEGLRRLVVVDCFSVVRTAFSNQKSASETQSVLWVVARKPSFRIILGQSLITHGLR